MLGLCCFSAQGHRGRGLLILYPILRKAPLLKRVASQIFRSGLFSGSPESAVIWIGTYRVNPPKMSDFEVRHAVRVGGGRSRFDL